MRINREQDAAFCEKQRMLFQAVQTIKQKCGCVGECIADLAALARDCPSYMAAVTVSAL